jgi:hypothetical protein
MLDCAELVEEVVVLGKRATGLGGEGKLEDKGGRLS